MSRRRRPYVLRFAYVGLLTAVVVRLWLSVRQSSAGGPGVVQVARLGNMGQQIVAAVVWFQFITGQILAAVLLSDAIGKEIRQRTLDTLLVTPIRSFQIVLGKLAGGLLQVVSLLAISLPMLAVVRVFGGVPWDYVVAGMCMTLAGGIFAAALSLLCSISSRDSYHAALTVVLWYLVLWGLVPALLSGLSFAGWMGRPTVNSILCRTNPFVALRELTQATALGWGGIHVMSWQSPCLILLVMAAGCLTWSVRRVRSVATRVIPTSADQASQAEAGAACRPVVGAPIVWKERCTPLFRSHRRGLLLPGALILVLAVIMAVSVRAGASLSLMAFFLIQVVQLLFVIDLAIAAAGAVTKEKEARTWPVLLMTPLDNGEIIHDKALGVLRRNLPMLLPVPVLYLLALLPDRSQQMHLWQSAAVSGLMATALVSKTLCLLGMGLYFSVRLRTTTAAIVATLVVYVSSLLLFGGSLGPLLFLLAGTLNRLGVHQGAGTMPLAMLAFALIAAGTYAGVGLLCVHWSAARVRRNVF